MDSYSQLQTEIRDTGLEDDTQINKWLEIIDRAPSKHLKKRYAQKIRGKIRRHRTDPFENVPGEYYTTQGNLYLGDDWKTDIPYSLPEDTLTEHILIAAQSGGGKTNLIRQFLPQLSIPYWILDLKQDYRHLLEHHDNITVIPKEELKINPLKPPPGVTRNEWKNRVIEVLTDAVHLLDASHNYIAENIIPLYEAHLDQIYHPISGYPTFHTLKKRVENQTHHPSSKEAKYRETVLNRLNDLTEGVSGQIFDTQDGYDLELLLQKNVVFELENLNTATQNFIMELLLEWEYQYRMKHPQFRGGDIHHLVVIDEGKQLFDRNKERNTAQGIPQIDFLTSKIRTLGVGLLAADQEARKLTSTLLANTNTKIILPNADHNQLNEMSKSMGLTKLQKRKAQNLDTGEAILKTGNQGPYRIDIAHAPVDESVTDEQVLEKLQSQHFYQTQDPGTGSERNRFSETENENRNRETVEIELGDDAHRFFTDIVENPFKPLSDRYSLFSSTGTGHRIKSEVVDAGLVDEVAVSKGTTSVKLFELTEQGRDYSEKHGLPVEHEGKGGIAHRYWQHTLKDWLQQQDWAAAVEKLDADVYGNNGDTELVIEVAMGKNKRELEHIQKHVDREMNHIVVGCRNKAVQAYIEDRLDDIDNEGSDVQIHQVHSLTDEFELPS